MKKAIIFFILMNFACAPVGAVISDDFARTTLDSSLKIKTYAYKAPVDGFVEASLDKNLQINNYSPEKFELSDDFVKKHEVNSPAVYKVRYLKDDFLPENIKITAKKTRFVDFSKSEVPVKIRVKNLISTKTLPDEGSFVEFETISEIAIKDKVYPKGTTVKGRIETMSGNGFAGVPADLVVGNFSVNGIPLQGELQKTGKNHAAWVRPCALAGSFFFGAGLLFYLVRGGQARILPDEIYTVYVQEEL